MGYVIQQAIQPNGNTIADNTVRFIPISGHIKNVTTESSISVPFVTYGGTFDKAGIYISANDVSSNSTCNLHDDGSDTALSISITGNATGLFEDLSNSVAIAADSLVSWEITVPSVSGSHSITINQVHARFLSDTNTYQRLLASRASAGTATLNSTTVMYWNLGGDLNINSDEARFQFKYRSSGTLRNMLVFVETNSGAACTVKSRVNTGDGGMSISIGSGLTGLFEDNSGTDSIADGDLVSFSGVRDSGAGDCIMSHMGSEFETSSSKSNLSQSDGATEYTASTTYYFAITGSALVTTITTEADTIQHESRFAATATNLQIYLTVNAATAAGTFTFRIDEADSGLNVSLTALTTGLFEDTTGSANVVIDDILNYSLAVGSGGNSTVSMMGCMIADATLGPAAPAPAATGAMRRRMLMGVGL